MSILSELKELRPVVVPMIFFLLGVVSSISYMSYAHMHEDNLSLPKAEWQCSAMTNVDTGMPHFVREILTMNEAYKKNEKLECAGYVRIEY